MNIALIIASIANPVITGLLTILFFLESKKSKKQIESIQSALDNVQKEVVSTVISSGDKIKNSIDKQKDDFTKLADRLELLSRDTEESANTPVLLSCKGVPLFVKFKDGKEVSRKVGWPGKQELKEWITNN